MRHSRPRAATGSFTRRTASSAPLIRAILGGISVCLVALAGCANGGRPESVDAEPTVYPTIPSHGPVRTGADVLVSRDFDLLAGRRVGLIVNHTARVDTSHLSDVIARAPDVELTALFGPEHGIRGTTEAGASVRSGRDVRTGVPVHSLYGRTNRPTPQMLQEVDVLVFDVQDVGARFYTYISTMGLAMQAAAEKGIPFVVLDRPNPLGGDYVSGFVLEPDQESFVGLYPIPIAHGMTVGELARMLKGEGLLDGLASLDLHVVPMEGWRRSSVWSETGFPWIAPSPNLPTVESALVYPGTCLFEAVNGSEGRGTDIPFLQVGAPYVDAEELERDLNARSLPGATFTGVTFRPESIPGMSNNPRFRGADLDGICIHVTDADSFQSVETGIHILTAFRDQARAAGANLFDRREWLARLAGTPRLAEMLESGVSASMIIESWQDEIERFRRAREPYLLYD